jgi:hypothetical protein
MSKYSDSEEFIQFSAGRNPSSNKTEDFTKTKHAMGSVIGVLPGNDDDNRGVGDILATIMNDQGRLKKVALSPMNPHMFTIPLPNEKIHCVKDSKTGLWYYTGIASERGMVNHLLNATNIVYGSDGTTPHSGEYFVSMPDAVRSLDLYEGDVVVQGRFGHSLRFTGSNPALNTPWQSSTKSASPLTVLRNGYLPEENFDTDSAGIWLTSDQYINVPLKSDLPQAIQSTKDKFGGGQIILFSDRLMMGSKTSDIILSSKKTIALCTQEWAHDVDIVLDTIYETLEQVQKLAAEVKAIALASAQQTFPVPALGSTLISVQAPNFASSYGNIINLEGTLTQLKTNLDALKQK